MAKISEAYVFVDEVEGNRLKLSEKHSKKNPMTNEWTTTGYTDITGWLPKDYNGPQLTKGTRIKVSGSQRSEDREANGRKYRNVIWNLETLEVVQGHAERPAQDPHGAVDPNEETPF